MKKVLTSAVLVCGQIITNFSMRELDSVVLMSKSNILKPNMMT
jgi:hypothetical protein